MSRFSGKCDLYDTVEMIYCDTEEEVQEFIDNSDFYMHINGRDVPIKITNRKELALYYPFLTSMEIHSNGRHVMMLRNDSFIDQSEQERLDSALKHSIREYRRAKKTHTDFDPEKVFSDFYGRCSTYQLEIAKRVAEKGMKATTEGIHTYMGDYYRSEWYNQLIDLGWSEIEAYRWVYKRLFFTEDEIEKRLSEWKDENNDKQSD